MGTRLAALALAWSLCAGAAAAEESGTRSFRFNASTAHAPSPEPSEAAEPEELPPEPLSLKDARMNFSTVIETFYSQNSPKGYWLFDDAAGKPLKLKLEAIDKGSIEAEEEGRYVGRVRFRDAGTSAKVAVRFTVDLSGAGPTPTGTFARRCETTSTASLAARACSPSSIPSPRRRRPYASSGCRTAR
jgi:hypothetical protein